MPRHDAWLRVEVFDKDNQSTDDLLGSVEIQLKDLSHVGAVKRWFPLSVPGHSETAAAIHLYLHYDVSALGEALSMVWAEQPKSTNKTPFDANRFYANAIELQKELEPYLAGVGPAVTCVADKSRRWFLVALIAPTSRVRLGVVHLSIILLLRIYKKRLREHTPKPNIASRRSTTMAAALDRAEIGLAIAQLAMKRKTSPLDSESINSLQKQTSIKAGHWT